MTLEKHTLGKTALDGTLRAIAENDSFTTRSLFQADFIFSNNPLQFGKTWFISSSLFLLAFSRCSGYNRSLKGRRESGI
jgi:hypothetical protein